jgi:flagellin
VKQRAFSKELLSWLLLLNTNTLSLTAQNNLNRSQSALGTAIERLSSGVRINSAKDDAAGQAIANRFTANIRGLDQAARNTNDGISIAQTTEGALNEVNSNLQRIRELSVQAANGSNSAGDLRSIQAEVDQRLAEITRISSQTQFNGVNVLASDNSLTIQVGANDDETITIDLKKIDAGTMNLSKFSIAGHQGATANTVDADLADIKDSTGTAVTAAKVTVTLKVDGAVKAGTLQTDSNGNLFVKVDKANAGAGALDDKFYAIDKKDIVVTNGAPPTGAVNLDIRSRDLSYASTSGALAAVDSGMAQV